MMLIFLCLYSSLVNAGILTCQHRHCVAIVDAGSTGSRLHVYAYDVDKKQFPLNIDEIWLNRVSPGLASVELKNLDTYLTTLFANAPQENIPVYFYATAGMRLVSSPKQQLYYQLLQNWFSTQASWILQDAKTITGKQEGIFGWLAVNYKLDTLQSSDKPMVGMMDMGGASVQIAVPAENTQGLESNDLVQLNTYGRHVTLFVHSFLGLGQTEVSHHYLNAPHCFPYDYILPNESIGQGDAQACQQDISSLINSVHHVERVVSPVLTANKKISWYAVSGLSTLVKNKLFHFNNNQFTSQEMLRQADNQFCHQSWPTLDKLPGQNDYTFINCLTASYYYGLLVNGYGIQPGEAVHFMPDEEEPDWTLGAVLQQHHA